MTAGPCQPIEGFTPMGWNHLVYPWTLRDPLLRLAIPLLGTDQALLDLHACFCIAYDRIGTDEQAGYAGEPPPPPGRKNDRAWVRALLREPGLPK